MKAAPLLIQWHNESQPIYSIHFDPHGKGKLATAGGDNNVRLWNLEQDGEDRSVTYLSTLTRHTQSVNVVRFSPKGDMLASAGDDGNVLLWVPSDTPLHTIGEDHAEDKETWRIKHMCRSNSGAEIYDLAWSPDGLYFITGGLDNTARIFNTHTGAMVRQIAEHNHYVQGVAWDPLNEFVATQSSDRSVHIYSLKLKDGTPTLAAHGKFNKIDLPGRKVSTASPAPADTRQREHSAGTSGAAIASPAPSNPGTPMATPLPMDPPAIASSRRSSFGSSPSIRRSASPAPSLPLPAVRPELSSPSLNAAMGLPVRNTNMYHSETLASFFRRLAFAPDGSLLFTPAGHYKQIFPNVLDPSRSTDEVTNTVYIYTRSGFNKPPVAHLPGHKKASVVVKCSPMFYNLRQSNKPTTNITIDSSSGADAIPPLPESIVQSNSSHRSSIMDPPPLIQSASSASDIPRPTSQPASENETKDKDAPPLAFSLPYRMVYAVATQDAVLVYDTQQITPLCVVSNLHYATFSDLAWSHDGLTLLMSSTDGYCSTLSFAPGELGTVYEGPHPTHTNPIVTTILHAPGSANGTPLSTPVVPASPSFPKASPVSHPPSHPSPASTFTMRPGSPTRSNSQSSEATMASIQTNQPLPNNPTPTLGHVPLVTATSSTALVGVPPMSTPPQTPASTGGHHSASNSISGTSVLGKREPSAASESEREDPKPKKRRVAPTLVGLNNIVVAPGPGKQSPHDDAGKPSQ